MWNGDCSGSENKIHEEENSRIKQMESEIARLNQKLRAKDLQRETAAKRHSDELKKIQDTTEKQIKELKKENREIKGKLERLVNEEIKNLKIEIEQKDQIIKIAQLEGEICNNSCVLEQLCWILDKKLPTLRVTCSCGQDKCRRKLEKRLFLYYANMKKTDPEENKKTDPEENKKTDPTDCKSLMYILQEIGIVEGKERFLFPPGKYSEDPKSEINKAWKEIIKKKMAKTDHVLILGRKELKDGQVLGHTVVCDLDAMPGEIRVDIHDPQKVLKTTVDAESFITYLEGAIGLILYTFNLKKFEEIIKLYESEDDGKTPQPHTSGVRIKELSDTLDTKLQVTETERSQDHL